MSGNRPERVIGRYALFDQIGAGGMATVHFGRLLGPAGFSKTVAIKRLHPHFARDPEFSAMFLDEARLAARVQHPNVVATLDVVAKEGELFLVMEFIEGLSLSAIFWEAARSGKRVPLGVIGALMVNILSGLHAAHEATSEHGTPLALIHRDVSPQNVLVGRDGVARVLDFGIAKAVGRSHTTREGRIKGKLAYMPPEQIRALPLDRRADIYAASVMLWELLTMRRLFQEDDDAATIWRAVHEDPPKPGSIVDGLPVGVDDIVMRGLSKKPEDRFATAREMAIAIEQHLGVESTLSVSDYVANCGRDVLERMASRVREIESVSDSVSFDIIDPGSAAAREQERIEADLPTQMVLPDLPALTPSYPARRDARIDDPDLAPAMALELDLPRDSQAAAFFPRVTDGQRAFGGQPVQPSQAAASSRPRAMTMQGGFTPGGGGDPSAPLSVPGASYLGAPPRATPGQDVPMSVPPLAQSQHPGQRSATQVYGAAASQPASRPYDPRGGSSGPPPSGGYDSQRHSSQTSPAMELAVSPQQRAIRPPLIGQRIAYQVPKSSSETGSMIAGVALLVMAGIAGAYLFLRPKPTVSSARAAPPAGGVERACEASRKRLQNGSDVGPLDTYGWSVDLWMARLDAPELEPSDPALLKLKGSDGALDPSFGIVLPKEDHGDVMFESAPSPPPYSGKEPGVVIRLTGGYAAAFFGGGMRPAFLKLADATFQSSGAHIGALYARCAHLPYHDVGAWFRAKDAQGAADAIGYQMGGFAEAPWVSRSIFSPVGGAGSSFESYQRRRAQVDPKAMDDQVRLLEGSDESSSNGEVTVVFSANNPLRASSMARWITKQAALD